MAVIHVEKFQQNKKEHLPPKSWRSDPHDAQLGQVLFYLVAHQIRATVEFPYPKPVMRLFVVNGRVSCYI